MSILVHYLGGFIILSRSLLCFIGGVGFSCGFGHALHIFPLYIRSELDRCTAFDSLLHSM